MLLELLFENIQSHDIDGLSIEEKEGLVWLTRPFREDSIRLSI